MSISPQLAAETLEVVPSGELLEACLLHFIPVLAHLGRGQKVVISLYHDAPSGGLGGCLKHQDLILANWRCIWYRVVHGWIDRELTEHFFVVIELVSEVKSGKTDRS